MKILDIIRKYSSEDNPKITKSDLMKYLKDSRMMTTHKTTTELIKEGKIKIVKPKDKPHSRIDYLVVNEENEFNKTYNSLAQIEGLLDMIHEPLRKFSEIDESKFDPESEVMKELNDLISKFITPYEDATFLILRGILSKRDKIHSEKDSQIIETKVIKILKKFLPSVYTSHNHEMIERRIISELKNVQHSDFAKARKINPNLISDFKEMGEKFERVYEKFKKEFSKTEQKTKNPHEKSD